MNGWPDGWTDDRNRGGSSSDAEPTRVMGHAQGGGPYPPAPHQGAEAPLPPELSPRRAAAVRAGQPAIPRQTSSQGPGGGGPRGGGGPGGLPSPGTSARPNWRRRITVSLVTLLVVILVTTVGTYFWADSKLNRQPVLTDYADRPPAGKGTNYLIVGSDSREGLSAQDKKNLHTGSAQGKRTDSMMILHTGGNGNTLLSLPRDSYVTIPAFTGESGKKYSATKNKLNAAFSWGGGELLAKTIEFNTGLHIDHYAEIGFSGFVKLVDSLGGVDMCLDKAIKDKNSGADFKKGCQTFDGNEALAFVRERYQESDGDIGRQRHQQQLLSALANQAATPGTVLNPFKLYPVLNAGLDTLIVDKDMSLWRLASMFWAMKGVTSGDGNSMSVPIADMGLATPAGSAVKWDMTRANKLFDQLTNDEKVTVKGGVG